MVECPALNDQGSSIIAVFVEDSTPVMQRSPLSTTTKNPTVRPWTSNRAPQLATAALKPRAGSFTTAMALTTKG